MYIRCIVKYSWHTHLVAELELVGVNGEIPLSNIISISVKKKNNNWRTNYATNTYDYHAITIKGLKTTNSE